MQISVSTILIAFNSIASPKDIIPITNNSV